MSGDVRVFFDTNVLVYCEDAGDRRCKKARDLVQAQLKDGTGVVSPQVLSEYFVTVTRKIAQPLTDAGAEARLRAYASMHVVPLESGTILHALRLKANHQVSYWDALILAAATDAGCTTVYSEDLAHGQRYGGLQVINPFV